MKNFLFVFWTLMLFLIFGCTTQKSILHRYGEIAPIRSEQNQTLADWQDYYFKKEDCKCVYGGEFHISIKENTAQTNNLMISLQGGGACWPGMVRCKPTATVEDVLTSNFTSELDARLNEEWHQVVIPYCDGSVYMGDTELDYNSDDEIDHWHNGLKNSVAALKLTQSKFPNISKIFLTGCSAGGYGTIIHLRFIRTLYPTASIYVLNESGPGLMRPDNDFWEMIDSSWNLSQIVPDNCEKCEGQMMYWYEEMLEDPTIKIALFSSYNDHIIGEAFLGMEPEDYKSLLVKTSAELNAKYPNQFKRFFINGKSHCIDDRDYPINGTKYWDWVLAFINDREDWRDILE